jgi:excisionase family DNA binding protein
METRQPSKNFMNAHDVSDYLRISLSTVHHLTRAGKLMSVKVGKQWRYNKDEIDLYLGKAAPILRTYEGRERRTFLRHSCLVQGFAVIPRGHESAWMGEGTVLNFSDAGILFEASEGVFYEEGAYSPASVKVRVILDSKTEFQIEGRVVRTEILGRTRFGIQFHQPQPELARGLEIAASDKN